MLYKGLKQKKLRRNSVMGFLIKIAVFKDI